MVFYDFPTEHWSHLRTTNPIGSTFATVRHRQRKNKGCGTRAATLSLVFKLCKKAEKCWRKLNGYQQIEKSSAASFLLTAKKFYALSPFNRCAAC